MLIFTNKKLYNVLPNMLNPCDCVTELICVGLLCVCLKPAVWAADNNDGGDIHYVHSVLIEYSSCAYMDSCRVLPSFQGPVTPLVFTRGLMLKRYFYAF